jgi:hypothetical protein
MIAALFAAALPMGQPAQSGSPTVSTGPEMQALFADPTRDPPLRPTMVAVLATCQVGRAQAVFSRGPEAFGFMIRLTAAQAASRQIRDCLDTEIDRRHLRGIMWFVPPMPPAGQRVR